MGENDQKQFIADLAEVFGVQSEEELAAVVKKIQPALPKLFQVWKQGGKQALAQGLQSMSRAQQHRRGGQIEYLRLLDGECVNGVEFHKKGGCMKCGGKAKTMQDGGTAKKRITKAQDGTKTKKTTKPAPKTQAKPQPKPAPKPVERGSRSGAPMPTQYNGAQHQSLIRRFQAAPKTNLNVPVWSRTRNFTPASLDSLQWFNAHDPNEDGV